MNNVVLSGRLVRDPETKFIQSTGNMMCSFTIAVDKRLSRARRSQFEAEGKPTADFIRIVAWGRQAEYAQNYFRKGSNVAIQGRIETYATTDENGNRRYSTSINAENVESIGGSGGNYSQNNSGFAPQADNQSNSAFGGTSDSGLIDQMSNDFDDSSFPVVDDMADLPF